MAAFRCTVVVFSVLAITVFGATAASQARKRGPRDVSPDALLEHLQAAYSKERNWLTQSQKNATYKYTMDFFDKIKGPHDLLINQHYYFDDYKAPGSNGILILKGSRWGTPADRVSLLGAHYDSQVNTSAVGDNGSGMAAMLEAAKMVAESSCPRLNSIIFVAFDWEEFGKFSDGKYSYGSEVYVNQHLVPLILEELEIPSENFRGAYILDTIMNYDSTPNSQTLPPGTGVLYPGLLKLLKDRDYRGDFLVAIGRKDDSELLTTFQTNWNESFTQVRAPFETITVTLPYSGRPSESWWNIILRDFLRSDHANFWDYEGSYTDKGLPAVFLTDTANFRGFMQKCYHQPCDNLEHVTSDQLDFLSVTSTTLAKSLLEFGTESQTCV